MQFYIINFDLLHGMLEISTQRQATKIYFRFMLYILHEFYLNG